jgi:predicted Ser/Thr protein kinase
MPIATDCPDAATLSGYARDDLSTEKASGLEDHLTNCHACMSHYLELQGRPVALQIPDCRFVKEIGRGRFGVVYKAWWTKGKPRIVALKLLTCPSEMERSRFDREVAVLKKLDSPSIVKCLDSGAAGEVVYYVMDFVDGVHLDEYLRKAARTLDEKLAVFARVCSAVAEAHAEGVVHRDLKPRNILIDVDGKPHILDFGICTVDMSDWSSSARGTITHPGDIIGTLKYMSPEQAWGGMSGPIDQRSDIWALGVMLYEIVTGDFPYSLEPTADKSIHEALLERIRKELPRVPRLPSVPRGRDLEILLSRCLSWEPERRIESAARLADDLHRYRTGLHLKTKPLGIPYRLKRLAVAAAARSRWTFSAAFVATVGLTLWIAALLFNVGWHVTGHQYEGPEGNAASLVGSAGARADIVVVGVSDGTTEAVVKFAAQHGIDGVTASLKTWRAVHGLLMERLALARPRAVVWDYYFRTPQAGDARLAAGARKLEEAGVPVMLAAMTFDENGTPDLSPNVTRLLKGMLRCGAIVARDMVDRPGEFVTAIKRAEDTVVPSLALTTLAAVLHPETRLDLDWQARNRWMDLLYQIRPQAYLRERDRIEFTRVFMIRRAQPMTRVGDLLACNTFELDSPEQWERRTVRYETLLSCSDARLRKLTGDKLIIIGDVRSRRPGFVPDRHRVRYGASTIKEVPGCYLLADAVAGLLERRYMKAAFPLPATTFLAVLFAATAGCLLPIRLAKTKMLESHRGRRLLWTALLTLSPPCFVVMVLASSYTAVHTGMAGFALLTAMTGSFWVEFARNRHRLADRKRRACEELRIKVGGTLTLPRKQPRSLPGTR